MRETCWKCAQRIEMCLCEHITKFATNTHFVFLVHPMEFKKEKIGTGRMTHTSLPNSSFLMGIDFTQDKQVNAYLNDPNNFCMILWPGVSSIEIPKIKDLQESKNKKLVVFILDGTWACARKMYLQSPNLQKLQKISITPTAPSIFVIKQQPNSLCLSTMEAVLYVLKDLEKINIENKQNWEEILKPFKFMVQRQIEISNDPSRKSYRGRRTYDLEAIQKRAEIGTRKRKLF
jgi:DTW domain-containing protein YfiP